LVKNTFSQRLRGSIQSSLPQDLIVIFLGDQRLQFVVADHLGQPHIIKDYSADVGLADLGLLNQCFAEDADLRKTYSRTILVPIRGTSLLEPSLKSSETNLSELLLPNKSNHRTIIEEIPSFRINVVSTLSESLISGAERMFANLIVHHHHTLLIQLFDRLPRTAKEHYVYVQVYDETLSIIAFKDHDLQYANQFDFESKVTSICYCAQVVCQKCQYTRIRRFWIYA